MRELPLTHDRVSARVLLVVLGGAGAISARAPAVAPATRVALAWAVAAGGAPSSAGDSRLAVRSSVEPSFAVADHRLVDLDERAGLELLVVGERGEVRAWPWIASEDGAGFAREPRGDLVLSEPERTLLALGSILDADETPELVVASPRGVEAWRRSPEGGFGGEPIELAARARMRWRPGRPTFASIVSDINADGRQDFVLPTADALELWIQAGRGEADRVGDADLEREGAAPRPTFRRAVRIDVEIALSRATEADELSDRLFERVSIPGLSMRDVNGDGRADLLVEEGETRAFHLVRADGTIPAQPDVAVDLGLYRDTTPEAELKPGRTLAGGDEARWHARDLDGDEIPDYVIAHRRKVWVFHGRPSGPQFTEPSTILKAADDVTALSLLALDDDRYPDLLLFKLQVPSIAAMLHGMLREWEVEIDAIGYRNDAGKGFDPDPRWRSSLALRLPAILSIVKDPEALIARFEDVGRKFRVPAEGDFDGDGAGDVALIAEDGTRLDLWLGRERGRTTSAESDAALLRDLLFGDEPKTWDVERILAWLGGYAERRIEQVTGGRAADHTLLLRDSGDFALESLEAGDPDGDSRAGLLLRYERRSATGRKVFDLVGLDG